MTIEVTGCHDCPFEDGTFGMCNLVDKLVSEWIFSKTMYPSCPLQTQSITIKKKPVDSGK